MKLHYFNDQEADKDDDHLVMAKAQSYVPHTCLLGGIVIMDEVTKGNDPCWGCEGPRDRCHGRSKAVR